MLECLNAKNISGIATRNPATHEVVHITSDIATVNLQPELHATDVDHEVLT